MKIKDIFEINPKNDLLDETIVSFIPMTLISDGFANKHTSEIRKWKDIKKGFTHFREGDVGIAKITPCFENRKSVVFQNLESGYGAGTTELHILRPIYEPYLSYYLIWFVKTEDFITNGVNCFTGAVGQQRVGKNIIEEMYLPVPPLAELHNIVSVIESAFKLIDEIESNKQDLSKFIKQAKSKVLDLSIRGKLVPQNPNDEPASALLEKIKNERKEKKPTSDNSHYKNLPKGWETFLLHNICEIYTGNSINEKEKEKKYTNLKEGHNYIGTKDIGFDNDINYENGIKIPSKDIESFRIAKSNSILLCIEGGSAGRKIGIVNQDVCFGNKLCCFYSSIINQKFLFYYQQSHQFKEIFSDNKIGLIGGVSVNNLKKMHINIPPIVEQHRIVSIIEQIFNQLNDIEKIIKA